MTKFAVRRTVGTSRIGGVALLTLTAIAGSAWGSTLPLQADNFCKVDISFQDGRTFSEMGKPNIHGIIESGDPEDRGPFSACCAPGTSAEVLAQVEAAMRAGYQSRYQIGARWNLGGGAGDPINLTWSFVPDGLSIPGGGVSGEVTSPSQLFSRMDTLFASQGGRAQWIAQFEACFARWEALTGVHYTRVRNAALNDWDDGAGWGNGAGTFRGEVRIAMHPIDGANNVLAYNQFPQNGDMVIDSSEGWNSSGSNWRFLRNTVMHEHGHGLGFNHVCPINNSKLMEPFLSTSFDGPQQDDARAGQANYGDPYEPNNSFGQATELGLMNPGQSILLGTIPAPTVANTTELSIEGGTKTDWFSFQVADPRLVDITVTPFGSSYANWGQDSQCNNNTINMNALTAGNLRLDVYKTNGSSLLRTSDDTAAGSAEVISGLMSVTGVNYIKVSAPGASSAQCYKINVAIRTTSLAASASLGTFTDKVRITWPAVPDATAYQVYRNLNNATFGGTTLATVNAPVTSFDDTTATPGVQYYYLIKAQQPDDTSFRFMTDTGNLGRRNAAPVANAGPDQNVVDLDNSGSESVTLDASASSDSDGTLSIFRWEEGATLLAQSGSPTAVVPLAQGSHTITLTVFDNGGATNTDEVIVNVVAPGGGCGDADFNGDGDVGTDADIEAFFACLGGDCCATCFPGGADFNGDGDVGTDADIEAFFRVLAGGNC